MATAAPVITREMDIWVSLGGGNSGIVGDSSHNSGFHRAANEVPASDYSRRRDPNGADGPFTNWSYACAGDFSHGNNENLRRLHRRVLRGLMNGQYPMICEFIGKPWPDRPVYYWARWNGIRNLRVYTGGGHTHWSHISWFRSRADEPANLWVGGSLLPCSEGDKGVHVEFWQRMLNDAGEDIGKAGTDGIFDSSTKKALNSFRDKQGWNPTNHVTAATAKKLMETNFGTESSGGPSREEIKQIIQSVIDANREELRGPAGKTPTKITFDVTGDVTHVE